VKVCCQWQHTQNIIFSLMGFIQNLKQLFHENNTQASIRENTLQYNAIINQERHFGVLQARFVFIKKPLSIMIHELFCMQHDY
jgi:hypothetical protein